MTWYLGRHTVVRHFVNRERSHWPMFYMTFLWNSIFLGCIHSFHIPILQNSYSWLFVDYLFSLSAQITIEKYEASINRIKGRLNYAFQFIINKACSEMSPNQKIKMWPNLFCLSWIAFYGVITVILNLQ